MHFTSLQGKCLSSNFASYAPTGLLPLPLLCFPCCFHSMTLLTMYPCLVSSACGLSNPNLFVFSSVLPVASLLVFKDTPHLRLGHQIRRMFLRFLQMNTCNFCFNRSGRNQANQIGAQPSHLEDNFSLIKHINEARTAWISKSKLVKVKCFEDQYQ